MIRPHGGSADFLFGLAMLFIEHPRLGAPGTLSLLAPNLGGPLFLRRLGVSNLGLDFIQQNSSGQETIELLGALLLALDPDTRRPVIEQHTGRDFIDVLAAGARRADKLLFYILLSNTQGPHALRELFFFVG